MKAKSFLKLLSLLLIIFISCNTFSGNKKVINKLEKSIQTVEKNYESLSKEEWSKLDQEIDAVYFKINSEKEGFSQDQIEKANNLIGKYQALKIKSGFNSIKGTLKNLGQQIEGAIKELKDTTH